MIRSCEESVTLLVCQPYLIRKSALLTATKKERLRKNPSKVRFADGVVVNGLPLFCASMGRYSCNCFGGGSHGRSSFISQENQINASASNKNVDQSIPLSPINCLSESAATDLDQQSHCSSAQYYPCAPGNHLINLCKLNKQIIMPNALKIYLENEQTKTFHFDGTTTVQVF